jgi:hypothetical protein
VFIAPKGRWLSEWIGSSAINQKRRSVGAFFSRTSLHADFEAFRSRFAVREPRSLFRPTYDEVIIGAAHLLIINQKIKMAAPAAQAIVGRRTPSSKGGAHPLPIGLAGHFLPFGDLNAQGALMRAASRFWGIVRGAREAYAGRVGDASVIVARQDRRAVPPRLLRPG